MYVYISLMVISMKSRKLIDWVLYGISLLATLITVAVLIYIVVYICGNGIPHLKGSLFNYNYTSDNVSMTPSIINTLLVIITTLIIALPIGISTAIYLHEYAPRRSAFVQSVRLMIQTLSGIPSIVYGLFGALFFSEFMHLNKSLIAGSLTLAIMILPTVITTTEDALIAVDDSLREASYGLGANKIRTIFCIVLPAAMNGIISGIVLSIGRIIGESAALLFTAGTYTKAASSLMDSGRTLAVHMYVISGEALYIDETYATATILIVIVLVINMIMSFITKKIVKGN